MSVLLETEEGWLISHQHFFEKMKVSVQNSDLDKANNSKEQYWKLDPSLFEIADPFRCLKPKGSVKSDMCSSDQNTFKESNLVQRISETMLNHPVAQNVFAKHARDVQQFDKSSDSSSVIENCLETVEIETSEEPVAKKRRNYVAAHTAQKLFETMKDLKWPEFRGENPCADFSVISTVNGCVEPNARDSTCLGHEFIFPPCSKFYCKDVSYLQHFEEKNETFDLIIMDPPWRNKFIRRKKRKQLEAGYQLITDDEIGKLPIKKLLKQDGIIAVWCTNARSHREAIITEIFPQWGVSYHETWYWLKITKFGIPICPFNKENNKQPYETIIIGKRSDDNVYDQFSKFSSNANVKVIISIPSSINSHKPPLINVLKLRFPIKDFSANLEIFARYLTPGFTSLGNEVIKLQHKCLFVPDKT